MQPHADPAAALARAALLLKNSNPEAWEAFLVAFDCFLMGVTVAVIDAPADTVLQKQGQAQSLRKLIQIFDECEKTGQPPDMTQPQPPPVPPL